MLITIESDAELFAQLVRAWSPLHVHGLNQTQGIFLALGALWKAEHYQPAGSESEGLAFRLTGGHYQPSLL